VSATRYGLFFITYATGKICGGVSVKGPTKEKARRQFLRARPWAKPSDIITIQPVKRTALR